MLTCMKFLRAFCIQYWAEKSQVLKTQPCLSLSWLSIFFWMESFRS